MSLYRGIACVNEAALTAGPTEPAYIVYQGL